MGHIIPAPVSAVSLPLSNLQSNASLQIGRHGIPMPAQSSFGKILLSTLSMSSQSSSQLASTVNSNNMVMNSLSQLFVPLTSGAPSASQAGGTSRTKGKKPSLQKKKDTGASLPPPRMK